MFIIQRSSFVFYGIAHGTFACIFDTANSFPSPWQVTQASRVPLLAVIVAACAVAGALSWQAVQAAAIGMVGSGNPLIGPRGSRVGRRPEGSGSKFAPFRWHFSQSLKSPGKRTSLNLNMLFPAPYIVYSFCNSSPR